MPNYAYHTGATVTLTAGTEESVIEFATPSTRRARPYRIVVGGFSVTASDPPAIVTLSQFDTAATGGSGITAVSLDPGEPATLMTGATRERSALPTGTQLVLAQVPVPPSGTLVLDLADPVTGELPAIAVSKIGCLSVLAHASGANQTIRASVYYKE